jgi:predicted ATPase/transcriptional regulator with XRE-family HTH domain
MSVPRREATFGSLLREHRLAAGLTQEALAERSGVSPRTIQEVEADDVHPRRTTALSLVEALGLSDPARDALLRMAGSRPRRRLSPTSGGVPERHEAPFDLRVPVPSSEPAVREPPLLTLPRPAPTNVPWPVSSLLGRESELTAIRDLIAEDRHRLVTLTGVGGSGKTRLAVQAAIDLLDEFADGVWFVELASTSSPSLVPRSVAGALGVHEVQDAPLLDTLLGFLRRKRLLLVLDNCEHLIEACAALAARLLAVCPDLSILATSREPLQIAGEHRRPIRPLDVPDPTAASFDALVGTSSVRLFAERARAIDPDFALIETNAGAVAEVCTRLDGIPLAIELAASRIGVLAVKEIAERLDDSFRLLAGGSRTAPTRQQTMEAALDWSYDLLTASEQATFRSLSVFAGGFTLDAAARVCSGQSAPGTSDSLPGAGCPPPTDFLDVLGSLVDKSLVVAERTPRERRYRLLEPVRQYAALSLATSGEEQSSRARHAAHYAALAERAAPLLRGSEQLRWLERLEAERDNLRAALGWIVEHGEVEAELRMAVALTPYWEARGYLSEGRRWLNTVLAASRASGASQATQMQALTAAGALAQWQADIECAEAQLGEALTAARFVADRRHEAEVLVWLSSAYWQKPDVERGLALGEEGLRLGRDLQDETVIAFALLNVGVGLRFARETARAVTVLDECLRRYRGLGDVRYVAIASAMLGWATLEAGQHDRAAEILRDALRDLRVVGDQRFIRSTLRALAQIARVRGEPRRAVQLFSAGEALRAVLGMRHTRREYENSQQFLASLRERLTPSEFDDARTAGEAMSLDQVLAELSVP